MELINATGMQAGYTMGMQPDGRELLVVAVKGTFKVPDEPDKDPVPAEEQLPLVHTDIFTGEPGFSATLYEIDYAPRKPRCDVLLNGSAYAPGGKPTDRVTVSLRVGSLYKSFDVVDNRFWKTGILRVGATAPEPFTVMPISYNNAFGGVDRSQEDPLKHRWYPANHAGVGYHDCLDPKFIDGKPLPNTEETGKKVTHPHGNYKPMAFGPVGRSWQPRIKWVGTYDQNWLDERFPFLPDDFDERYFQSAPEDQQTDYLRGGEVVELMNLTPRGWTVFKLPGRLQLPVVFFLRTGERKEVSAVVDTLVLEPDQNRFLLVWRANIPLRRTIREVLKAALGRTADEWERLEQREQRQSGKQRFASLAEAARSRPAGNRK